jgi:hypothetical protein
MNHKSLKTQIQAQNLSLNLNTAPFQTKLLQKTLSVASKNRKVSISKSRQGERIFDPKNGRLCEFAHKRRSWQPDFRILFLP